MPSQLKDDVRRTEGRELVVGYCVTERFDARTPESWASYLRFSGLRHLREVVGFDSSLCPIVHDTMTAEDWANDAGLGMSGVFTSADYARGRVTMTPTMQLLAIARQPTEADVDSVVLPDFEFMGFDLVDADGATSSLTNCNGFPKALNATELSNAGLIRSLSAACAVQKALQVHYPDEHHALCHVWAIWRWTGA